MDVMEPFYRVLCAGTASAIANTATYPLDLVRARMTLPTSAAPLHDAARYSRLLPSFLTIYKSEVRTSTCR